MEGGHHAEGRRPLEHAPVHLHIGPAEQQLGQPPFQIGQRHQRRRPLGQHRCDGRPGNSHGAGPHKEKIQPHIQHGGRRQGKQGRQGVPRRPQSRRAQVIEKGHRQTEKDHIQILRHQGPQLPRGLDQPQQGPQQNQAPQPQNRRQQQAEHQGEKPLPPERGQVPAAVKLGKEHRDARTAAAEDENEQVHHRTRHPHGPEGGAAQKAADDEGVHRVVELLQDIPADQGQGQPDQLPGNTALGQYHSPVHGKLPPFLPP